MRKDTGARLPIESATSDRTTASGSDSTLKHRMSAASASSISLRVFPTPENTIRFPGTPAAKARLSSPTDTMSIPAPSRASVLSTAWFELAFMA